MLTSLSIVCHNLKNTNFFTEKKFLKTNENENNLFKKLKPYDFPHLMTIESANERC